jgi:predicted molibdopterin-dependent oxidoreductase YjgC
MKKVPVVTVDINPADANEMNIRDGQDIQISSRRGEIIARVHVVDRMQRGDLFVPFVALEGVAANILTNDALDLPSGIPEYKACAVRLDVPGSTRKTRKKRSTN